MYFNPRSRVGNDQNDMMSHYPFNISIHVPAWGTTLQRQSYNLFFRFQSTFPRGERRRNQDGREKIHNNFNPRSRVGNDGTQTRITHYYPEFQSTFPRGERQCLARYSARKTNFNPRSRVGNDEGQAETCPFVIYFNPRSRVGNDFLCQLCFYFPDNFNPRSRVGNDVAT